MSNKELVTISSGHHEPTYVAVLVTISWLGLLVHNTIEQVDTSTILMAGVGGAIFLVAWKTEFNKGGVSLLILLGTVHLAGSIVSVLPLNILPFAPVQTVTHYLAHILYGLAQVPLLVVTIRRLPKMDVR